MNPCSKCIDLHFIECESVTIDAGLNANTLYYWDIMDHFGSQYSHSATTDGAGILTIDKEMFPPGFFTRYHAAVEIWVTSDEDGDNLVSLTYDSVVYDCIIARFDRLAETTPLSATCSHTNDSEFGADDGTASVVAVGGTPDYTYLWSNGATTATITGLSAGEYSVTVTDADSNTVFCSTVVTEPDEEGDTFIDVNTDDLFALRYPFLGASFNNMSTKGRIATNPTVVALLAALKNHIIYYPGDGNNNQVLHYKITGGEGYNAILQEVINVGKTLATIANGVNNVTYGFDFFEDCAKVIGAIGCPYAVLGVNITGMLSPYASTSLIQPNNVDWDGARIDLVITDNRNARTVLFTWAPSSKILAWSLQDEASITGNRKIYDNSLGAEHGVNVYVKALTHKNAHSPSESILDALHNDDPDALLQTELVSWKTANHKYTSVDGVQNYDSIATSTPKITAGRGYLQIPHPVTSYADARAYLRDHIQQFFDYWNDPEVNGLPVDMDQFGTDVPVDGYNESCAKGLILVEGFMLLHRENHNNSDVIVCGCNYNLKTMFNFGNNYSPFPSYYFHKQLGDWLEDTNGWNLCNVVLPPELDDLEKACITNGSEFRLIILNPTPTRRAPSAMLKLNGTIVTTYHNHQVCGLSSAEPTTVLTSQEIDDDDMLDIREYGVSVIKFNA